MSELISDGIPLTRAPVGQSAQHADTVERPFCAWIALAACALIAALAAPFWAGLVYTFDDLGAFHLPLRQLYAEELARGRVLTWTPALYGGFFIAGEGQIGAFHPLHLALYRCLPLRAAFCLEVLVNYPLMLGGMYLFLRDRLRRRDAALFGALAFTFTGFNLLHIVHVNGIAVLAHLPWALWAIDRLFAATSRRACGGWALLIALLIGSQILLGYPQFVWFTLLSAFALVAYLWRFELGTRRLACATLVAIAAGIALGSVQLLPTADVLSDSVREDISRRQLVMGSLHPWNFAQLVGPYLFRDRVVARNPHEFTLYVGAVPLLLCVWLVENLGMLRGRLRFVVCVLAFGGLALLLALGAHGYLYEAQLWLPVVGKFRFASRYVALFALAIAILAAIAVGELAKNDAAAARGFRPKYRATWPAIVVLISILVALAAPFWWGSEHLGASWKVAAGPFLLAAALALLVAAMRGSRPAIVGLALLMALDLGIYGLSYAVYSGVEPLAEFAAFPTPPPGEPGARVLADVVRPPRVREGNRILLSGWQRIDGYAGLEPKRQLNYQSLAALRVSGTRFVARLPETESIEGLVAVDTHWFAVPAPLPQARLVSDARVSNSPAVDLAKIDLEATALVAKPVEIAAGPQGSAKVMLSSPGELNITTQAESDQLLVLTESYHSGWQACVDGLPVETVRVNGDFLGCVVPAGRHSVELRFSPTSLRFGYIVSLATASLLAIAAAVNFGSGKLSWRR